MVKTSRPPATPGNSSSPNKNATKSTRTDKKRDAKTEKNEPELAKNQHQGNYAAVAAMAPSAKAELLKTKKQFQAASQVNKIFQMVAALSPSKEEL